MSGLLSGLESLGLGNLENMSLYETAKEKEIKNYLKECWPQKER